jgi:hypothetical protein
MPQIELAGKSYEVDEDGFLQISTNGARNLPKPTHTPKTSRAS